MDERENTTYYYLLIDGIETAFSSSELADDDFAAEIGFDRFVPGFVLPTGLQASLDLRSGLLEDTTVSLQIVDVTNDLASIFSNQDPNEDYIYNTLHPADAPPPELYGKHVGLERIGPAGERRRYSCVPGFHIGLNAWSVNDADRLGVGAAPVTDVPILWPGRRCAVYRRQFTSGVWGEPQRIWWGTLLGQGALEGRTWTLKAQGPESWVFGTLGLGVQDSKPVVAINKKTSIDDDKVYFRIQIYNTFSKQEVYEYVPPVVEDVFAGLTDYQDLVDALNDYIDDKIAAAGGPWDWINVYFNDTPGQEGIHVRWEPDSDPEATPNSFQTLNVTIKMSDKNWATLGYNTSEQNGNRDPVENYDQYGLMTVGQPQVNQLGIGSFFSADPPTMKVYEEDGPWETVTDEGLSNAATARRWPPMYPGGAQYFLMDEERQEFYIRTFDPLFLPKSQTTYFPESFADPTAVYKISNGGGEVTATGLMLFQGPYRPKGYTDEQIQNSIDPQIRESKATQIARVAWREAADGSVSTDNDGYPRLVIIRWLDPYIFGVEKFKLSGTWAGWIDPLPSDTPMIAQPFISIEPEAYQFKWFDGVERIFHMVLSSTGTGTGIGGTKFLGTVDQGQNADLFGGFNEQINYLDLLPSYLGMGVPKEMLGTQSALFQQISWSYLDRAKVAWFGGLSARTLWQRLLAPLGVCISLRDGKYGLFDAWGSTLDASTEKITEEWYAGTPGDPASARAEQELREWSPIDLFKVSGRNDVLNPSSYAVTFEERSRDKGSAYRGQTISHTIQGDYLIHPALNEGSWRSEFNQRWKQGADWWASQSFPVRMRCHANMAINLWPGTPVTVNDSWISNPSTGRYGLSNGAGYVYSRTFDARTETIEVVALVAPVQYRMYAPVLAVDHYDENENEEGYRLHCHDSLWRYNTESDDDHSGIRNLGLEGFQPPTWFPAVTTETDIEIYQYDGVTWSRGIYGVCVGYEYDTHPASSTDVTKTPTGWLLLDGALTGGTFYRDMHHLVVLRKNGEQSASWVGEVYSPVCDEDGNSQGEKGPKWVA